MPQLDWTVLLHNPLCFKYPPVPAAVRLGKQKVLKSVWSIITCDVKNFV